MKKSQALRRLGPRVKLLKRHIREWNVLLIHQRQVRLLTKENVKQDSASPTDIKMAILQQITKQGIRLFQLIERQVEERQQMKARHQQEDAELEQVINTL